MTHRANYTFEMGEWHATCRICGHSIVDRDRRRAASYFRHHIQDMAATESAEVIDLRVMERDNSPVP